MKSIFNLFGAATILTTFLLASQISACGQKGPLYLQAEPAKPVQSTPQPRTVPGPAAVQPITPADPAASAPVSK